MDWILLTLSYSPFWILLSFKCKAYYVFETGFHCIALSCLEFTMQTRSAWPGPQTSACLCLTRTEISGLATSLPHMICLILFHLHFWRRDGMLLSKDTGSGFLQQLLWIRNVVIYESIMHLSVLNQFSLMHLSCLNSLLFNVEAMYKVLSSHVFISSFLEKVSFCSHFLYYTKTIMVILNILYPYHYIWNINIIYMIW